MGNLNPNLLAQETAAVLVAATGQMRLMNKPVLMPEAVLLALIDTRTSAAWRILEHLAGKRGFKLDVLRREVELQARSRVGRDASFTFTLPGGEAVRLSQELLKVIDDGLTIAQAADEVWIGTEHLLGAMCQAGVSTAGVLQKYGVTPTAVADMLMQSTFTRRTTVDWVALARAGELPPVHYRPELLRQLANLLSLAAGRHVILIGPAGVGKRSLVYGLAQLAAEGKGPAGVRAVVEISESALLDNAAEALRAGAAQAQGGVLFVPNVHRFFGGIIKSEFPKGEAPLQKVFLDERVAVIGTTTQADYDERIRPVTAIVEHSHTLPVPPTSVPETVQILATLRPQLESDYKLEILPESLEVTASLAHRYLSATALPGSAVQLLHRACALVRVATQKQLTFGGTAQSDARLDADDVLLACSQMSGIPVTRLGADERTRYAQMADHLMQVVVGQDEAVLAISRAVKTARVGLKDPRRPIGSFLFLGPTGVGKTELAKQLADFMFGSEEAMVVLDMSEYQQEDSLNRLIGAAPGYVGYEGGGQLTEAVRQRPYTVVLLDEAEKAHPRILDVLLQMMEEGRLTDGQGRVASFAETVIILTSNLGASYLVDLSLDESTRQELALAEVRAHFRPEFLNRLDDIIMFNALPSEALRRILGLLLKKEFALVEQRGLALETTEAARDWLLAQNEHPEWGARPLRRILQKHVRQPLADFLLEHDPPPGTNIRIDRAGDGLHLQAV